MVPGEDEVGAPPRDTAVVGWLVLVVGGLVDAGRRLVDRERGVWWLLHRAVFVTVGVGAVAAIPLAGATVVSPPLGAAGPAVVLVLLGVALHAALRPRRPRPGPAVSEERPTR